MPKVAYSEEERAQIRERLLSTALEQMARQGIQHTTVEQIYRAVGISRTFFYTFFSTKEDLIMEMLYLQQPKILARARELMADPSLSWREGVTRFLQACCYGERSGIAVLTIEEQQMLFRRLTPESYRLFRERQMSLFGRLLACFGVNPTPERVSLFTNLCLSILLLRRAVPHTLPLLVPEAVDAAVAFQIDALVDELERQRAGDTRTGENKEASV